MSKRVSDESLRHYLVGQDSLKKCDCFQCKCALDLFDARKQIAEQAEEIQALVNRQAAKDEEIERMKARLNAYYGECKPCSRCAGTGKDPLVKNCTCDCCEGTGWEVDA